jgi:Ca-activated chloride channel homolog
LLFVFSSPLLADAKLNIQKGNKLAKKQDFSGARGAFESALIDAPEMPHIPYNIGLTYYAEGRFDDAKREFEKTLAMTEHPDLVSKTYYNLGHVAFAEGKRSEAIDYFKQSLKINPRDEDAKYNIEYIRSGKTPQNPPPQPQPQKNGQDQQDQEDQQQQPERQPGQLSKEDAERILQMMDDQEKQKMKSLQPLQHGKKDDKKDDTTFQDW